MPIHKQKPEYTGSKSLDEIICYLEGRDIKSFTRNGRTLIITLFNGTSYNVTLPEGGGGGKCCYMAGDGINITEDNEIETNAELSKTTEAISVKGDIGSYSDGDIIDAGTSVEEILMKLLKKVVDVDTVLPTATITINANGTYEVGSELSVAMTTKYTDGRFVGKTGYSPEGGPQYNIPAKCASISWDFYVNNVKKFSNATSSKQYTIPSVGEETYTFSNVVRYGESAATPVKNDGTPSSVKIPAGTTQKNSVSINGAYKYFYGYIDTGNITDFTQKIRTKDDLLGLNLGSAFCTKNGTTTIPSMTSGVNGKNSLILVLPEKYKKITYTENSLGAPVNVDEKWLEQTENGNVLTISYTNGGVTTRYHVYILYSLFPIQYKNIKFAQN